MFITSDSNCRYVFGDVASPSEEAAILLESIVHNEMRNVVSDCSRVCVCVRVWCRLFVDDYDSCEKGVVK